MTFNPGGIMPSSGAGSDLVSVTLSHGEPVLRANFVRELLASEGKTRNWLKEYGIVWKPEVTDDGDK